ncbi:type III secretion system export apparatus subunit SctU [Acerihabitans arboris]|uniref:EscU/YscU/HrcU family type III secretion system export apparatus switch protein n=1 Tax=Acerihabitans arboris TaxID=2691583 RepID=A0A845SEZ9_9GAMM|nr:type III secretion system export apparatus subunit SctU [Acerihabitans arboris]NDL63380.1 EscU/YscU/HrcU family type III secretion system export apparatus switch protein [Acerihabitans arboris]
MAEKTENATPQKLRESRRKGQVGQSQDIPKLFICVGLLETLFATAVNGMQRLEAMMILPLQRLGDPFEHAAREVALNAALALLYFCGTACALILVLRILGGWVQFGPLFATEALTPKFDALNPVAHLKNMFSARQLTQLLGSLLKAAAVSVVIYLAVKPDLAALARLAFGSLDDFWLEFLALFTRLSRLTLGVLLVLSAIDFGVQKYFFLKQQRMSHEDIRNEYKQNEGDPHMKGHRRQMAQNILNEQPKSARPINLQEADVLLVNPTHYAVGLYYRPGDTPLPRVVFKTDGYRARELIDRAQRIPMPVIRFIWLTRTLYRTVDEGQYIPRETLKAVAQVYRVLRELEEQQLDAIIEIDE